MEDPIFLTFRASEAGSAYVTSSSGVSSAGSPTTQQTSTSSLVFTLPISCQICLSKVKDPVICSNRHVFCKHCMDVWLQRNQQCPACRVEVNPDNPCRSILGGLSVGEDVDDDDDPEAEAAKESRNSKKNLRKARIELLFNEYEEEIEDAREEIKELREKNARLEEEVRVAKSRPVSIHNAAPMPRDPQTSAMLVGLTAKLTEANQTYHKVLKEMETLKKDNDRLKGIRDDMEMEMSRLRSRLQLRSPAKMGRYATVAMESEVATIRQEADRLKKALALADGNLEKIQLENEHLVLFHSHCHDNACPLKMENKLEEPVVRPKVIQRTDPSSPRPTHRQLDRLAFSEQSPSSSLRHLTLQSPKNADRRLPAVSGKGPVRSLFSDSGTRDARSFDDRGIGSNGEEVDTSISSRFSLPPESTSSNLPSNLVGAMPSGPGASAVEEEASELNVSMEPDVEDCLSLMRAAERNVLSRQAGGEEFSFPDRDDSRSSSSLAASDSTTISAAFYSSVDSDVETPPVLGREGRSLKREISRGEIPLNKTPKKS